MSTTEPHDRVDSGWCTAQARCKLRQPRRALRNLSSSSHPYPAPRRVNAPTAPGMLHRLPRIPRCELELVKALAQASVWAAAIDKPT